MVVKRAYVKYLENFASIEKDEIIQVSLRDAHALVEEGIAEIVEYNPKEQKITKAKSKRVKAEEDKPEEKKIQIDEEEIKKKLIQNYELIQSIIKEYSDLDAKYLPIIASWIIGTYMHESFESYPYLFINAMRGSGKSRLLKLIACLCRQGEITNNISEAVLFRSGKGSTLCIDEFEGVGSKESSNLRELLNSAYKRGAKVKRMKKKKSIEGEDYIVEEFPIYFPIAMANIYGMEEVLGDRCITIILDKSHRPEIVKLIENYEENEIVLKILSNFKEIESYLCSFIRDDVVTKTQNLGFSGSKKAKCSKCSVVTPQNIHTLWNNYIKDKYIDNKTTLTTYTTINTLHYTKYISFFNKIDSSGINGRNLELSFPLFLITNFLGDLYVDEIIKVLEQIIHEKNDEEKVESRDVVFLRFLASLEIKDYISVNYLTSLFKVFAGDDEIEEKWINAKWVGRALRRLRLAADKRRVSKGIEVLLNLPKAKEKFKYYE